MHRRRPPHRNPTPQVCLHEYFVERNKVFLIMELLRGGELLEAVLQQVGAAGRGCGGGGHRPGAFPGGVEPGAGPGRASATAYALPLALAMQLSVLDRVLPGLRSGSWGEERNRGCTADCA